MAAIVGNSVRNRASTRSPMPGSPIGPPPGTTDTRRWVSAAVWSGTLECGVRYGVGDPQSNALSGALIHCPGVVGEADKGVARPADVTHPCPRRDANASALCNQSPSASGSPAPDPGAVLVPQHQSSSTATSSAVFVDGLRDHRLPACSSDAHAVAATAPEIRSCRPQATRGTSGQIPGDLLCLPAPWQQHRVGVRNLHQRRADREHPQHVVHQCCRGVPSPE